MNQTKPVDNDPVNRPSHYTSHPSGVECITVTEHMSFNVGNAIKYLWRAGQKGAQIQDLEKARWYVDREIKRLQVEKSPLRVDIGTRPEPPFTSIIGKQPNRDPETVVHCLKCGLPSTLSQALLDQSCPQCNGTY